MGGYGSSRWKNHQKKRTVESCFTLDVQTFIRDVVGHDAFTSRETMRGSIIWRYTHGGERATSVRYVLQWGDDLPTIRLKYHRAGIWNVDVIAFARIQPGFGGVRYYFRCPGCGRRVSTLHFFAGENFRCRKCHNLTYARTQQQRRLPTTGYIGSVLRAAELIEDHIKLEMLFDKLEKCRVGSKNWHRVKSQIDTLQDKYT
ncbi:MAG: hypothetical protein AAF653_16290 [Chloroflexota bacterium]